MSDPNWLLSTTAQCAAAIVAIIGGFLVSRLVSLASERDTSARRRQEIEARLALARAQHDAVAAETRAVAGQWFRDHYLDEIVDQRGGTAVTDLPDFIPIGGEDEDVLPWVEEIAAEVGEAFRQVEAALGPAEIWIEPEELQRRGVDVERLGWRLVEKVATKVATGRRPAGRLGSFADFSGMTMSPLVAFNPRTDEQIAAQRRRVERRDDLRGQLVALEAEHKIVDEVLSRLKQPEGVGTALLVLVYFALVGVVVPLIMLAQRPVPSSVIARRFVIALFVSGLSAVVGFILVALRRLRD